MGSRYESEKRRKMGIRERIEMWDCRGAGDTPGKSEYQVRREEIIGDKGGEKSKCNETI